jgi:hypothetical protein
MPVETRAVDCQYCGERIDAHENAEVRGDPGSEAGLKIQGKVSSAVEIYHEGCVESGKNARLGEFG